MDDYAKNAEPIYVLMWETVFEMYCYMEKRFKTVYVVCLWGKEGKLHTHHIVCSTQSK